LLVLPRLVARAFGGTTALVFAAALAVSPQLVYHSRYARPYMIVALLSPIAILAFSDWWETRRRGSALVYAAAATLASYFHLLAAPAVFSPFLVAATGLRVGSGRGRGADLLALARLGLATGVTLAALLAPPWVTSAGSMLEKAGRGSPDRTMLISTAHLFAGTSDVGPMIAFWTIVGLGALVCWRRHRRVASFLLVAFLSQTLGVWLARPHLVEIPIVYARYCVGILPVALILFALPFGEAAAAGGALRRAGAVGAAGALLWLYLSGPLPSSHRRPNNFTNHPELVPDGFPRVPLRAEEVPDFYRDLAGDPDRFSIIEAPWFHHWQGTPFQRLQRVHGKEVLIGFPRPTGVPSIYDFPFRRPLLRFRHYVDLEDRQSVVASGARYLILHADLASEVGPVASRGERAPDVSRVDALCRDWFGPPVFVDERIVAFDLRAPGEGRRVHREGMGSESSAPRTGGASPRDAALGSRPLE
jgi:hypothetical protein